MTGGFDTAYVLWVVIVLALCTVITRAGYLFVGDWLPLPEGLRRALRFAPVATLVGIIVPDLLPWSGHAWPEVDLRLPAAVFGIWVMARTRSAVLTIVAGMLALWLLQWLLA